MKKLFSIVVLMLLGSCGMALAQAPVQLCYSPAGSPSSCWPVNAANPLPVTGGGGGGGGVVTNAGTFPVQNTAATPAGTNNIGTVNAAQSGSATAMATAAPTAATFGTLLASSSTRKACLIQNNGLTTGYVYFGANGSATTGNSFVVGSGGSISCTNNNVTATDNVAGTCASGTCAFVISSQ